MARGTTRTMTKVSSETDSTWSDRYKWSGREQDAEVNLLLHPEGIAHASPGSRFAHPGSACPPPPVLIPKGLHTRAPRAARHSRCGRGGRREINPTRTVRHTRCYIYQAAGETPLGKIPCGGVPPG